MLATRETLLETTALRQRETELNSNRLQQSLTGSSVHGILQARILERVAMPSSRGSALHRDRTYVPYVSCIGRQVFSTSDTWEGH